MFWDRNPYFWLQFSDFELHTLSKNDSSSSPTNKWAINALFNCHSLKKTWLEFHPSMVSIPKWINLKKINFNIRKFQSNHLTKYQNIIERWFYLCQWIGRLWKTYQNKCDNWSIWVAFFSNMERQNNKLIYRSSVWWTDRWTRFTHVNKAFQELIKCNLTCSQLEKIKKMHPLHATAITKKNLV